MKNNLKAKFLSFTGKRLK